MKHGAKRQQIVTAADELFYQQGFEATAFADITQAVQISRGNLYHHFKAKDDILDAVIDARLENTRTTLAAWQADGATPLARLDAYVESLLCNWPAIKEHGCPVGTLCSELAKLDHAAHGNSVELFTLFRDWLCSQLTEMNSLEDPDDLAMDLLIWGQGIAAMGNAFKDLDYVKREVQKKRDWLKALPLQPG